MSINDGGPAFPLPAVMGEREVISSSDYGEGGISMRDYFAAKAMQAILSSPNCPIEIYTGEIAKESYMVADAMIKARSIEQNQ
jgi:hypothetical protein